MKGIIACEKSQEVTKAFRAKGHEFYSCDILDCSGGHPEWHIKSDGDMHLKDILYNQHWDFVGGHPPCTRLTNSVWWYILKNNLQDETRQAAIFFNMILNCPAKLVYVENPVMNKLAKTLVTHQSQSIQPYNFGEDASKQTCLWLRGGLPLLTKTKYVEPRIVNGKKRWANQTDGGWNKLGPSDDRAMLRSKTYPGIAAAMADQWG